MNPEDFMALFRMFAVALGGAVIALAVGRHVRDVKREQRREELQREWDRQVAALRKKRQSVTFHRATAEWRFNHGPKDVA